MAYAKMWIPPTVPLRDNLTAWKELFYDMHVNLLAAGLVTTDTEGQLNAGDPSGGLFPDVTSLPSDNTYAGFIEYALDDAMQSEAPVIIKIEYGCGVEGVYSSSTYSRNRTPRTRVTVSFNGTTFSAFAYPQSYNPSGGQITDNSSAGVSYFSHDVGRGFLGLFYGVGTRGAVGYNGQSATHQYGGYVGASLSLLLQRTVDEYGDPTDDGLMIFRPNITTTGTTTGSKRYSSRWANDVVQSSICQYIGKDGANNSSDSLANFIGGTGAGIVGGEVQLQQIYATTPALVPFPWVFTYAHPYNAPVIPTGDTFEMEVYGQTHTFIAVGNETCLSLGWNTGQFAGIAILFEND